MPGPRRSTSCACPSPGPSTTRLSKPRSPPSNVTGTPIGPSRVSVSSRSAAPVMWMLLTSELARAAVMPLTVRTRSVPTTPSEIRCEEGSVRSMIQALALRSSAGGPRAIPGSPSADARSRGSSGGAPSSSPGSLVSGSSSRSPPGSSSSALNEPGAIASTVARGAPGAGSGGSSEASAIAGARDVLAQSPLVASESIVAGRDRSAVPSCVSSPAVIAGAASVTSPSVATVTSSSARGSGAEATGSAAAGSGAAAVRSTSAAAAFVAVMLVSPVPSPPAPVVSGVAVSSFKPAPASAVTRAGSGSLAMASAGSADGMLRSRFASRLRGGRIRVSHAVGSHGRIGIGARARPRLVGGGHLRGVVRRRRRGRCRRRDRSRRQPAGAGAGVGERSSTLSSAALAAPSVMTPRGVADAGRAMAAVAGGAAAAWGRARRTRGRSRLDVAAVARTGCLSVALVGLRRRDRQRTVRVLDDRDALERVLLGGRRGTGRARRVIGVRDDLGPGTGARPRPARRRATPGRAGRGCAGVMAPALASPERGSVPRQRRPARAGLVVDREREQRRRQSR